MKKILIRILIGIGILILIPVLIILWFSITAYNPPDELRLDPLAGSYSSGIGNPDSLTLLTWNLGYGGLDKDTDFILDGGEMSLPRSKEAVGKSLDGIMSFLKENSADIYFIQEVDFASARTWKRDERAMIAEQFNGYEIYSGTNYLSPFVPFPPAAPLGKVDSGILTLTRYTATEAYRYQLPGEYSWPVKIFHLKRCASMIRFPSSKEDKDWCLINVHLTAYGDGTMRAQQLAFLKDFIDELYKDGNFVVVGGDWNSMFPGTNKDQFGSYTTEEEDLYWLQSISAGWTPSGWQWCYDPLVSTCRSLEKPYVKGENFECIIDGFLVSPNLEVTETDGYNLGYVYTDHNPVSISVKIK